MLCGRERNESPQVRSAAESCRQAVLERRAGELRRVSSRNTPSSRNLGRLILARGFAWPSDGNPNPCFSKTPAASSGVTHESCT
mmetsp:Transcript_747/g.1577  ORF Transcript_747/g.1577 Transcript_747/m.1577 type:complete len:84 (-) Transcript_747:67-318(-)